MKWRFGFVLFCMGCSGPRASRMERWLTGVHHFQTIAKSQEPPQVLLVGEVHASRPLQLALFDALVDLAGRGLLDTLLVEGTSGPVMMPELRATSEKLLPDLDHRAGWWRAQVAAGRIGATDAVALLGLSGVSVVGIESIPARDAFLATNSDVDRDALAWRRTQVETTLRELSARVGPTSDDQWALKALQAQAEEIRGFLDVLEQGDVPGGRSWQEAASAKEMLANSALCTAIDEERNWLKKLTEATQELREKGGALKAQVRKYNRLRNSGDTATAHRDREDDLKGQIETLRGPFCTALVSYREAWKKHEGQWASARMAREANASVQALAAKLNEAERKFDIDARSLASHLVATVPPVANASGCSSGETHDLGDLWSDAQDRANRQMISRGDQDATPREQAYATQIRIELAGKSDPSVVVVVGSMHLEGLRRLLIDEKVPTASLQVAGLNASSSDRELWLRRPDNVIAHRNQELTIHTSCVLPDGPLPPATGCPTLEQIGIRDEDCSTTQLKEVTRLSDSRWTTPLTDALGAVPALSEALLKGGPSLGPRLQQGIALLGRGGTRDVMVQLRRTPTWMGASTSPALIASGPLILAGEPWQLLVYDREMARSVLQTEASLGGYRAVYGVQVDDGAWVGLQAVPPGPTMESEAPIAELKQDRLVEELTLALAAGETVVASSDADARLVAGVQTVAFHDMIVKRLGSAETGQLLFTTDHRTATLNLGELRAQGNRTFGGVFVDPELAAELPGRAPPLMAPFPGRDGTNGLVWLVGRDVGSFREQIRELARQTRLENASVVLLMCGGDVEGIGELVEELRAGGVRMVWVPRDHVTVEEVRKVIEVIEAQPPDKGSWIDAVMRRVIKVALPDASAAWREGRSYVTSRESVTWKA
jgi:hypothetical protein